MTLARQTHSLNVRSRHWTDLNPEERKRRAIALVVARDTEGIWSLTEAYLTMHTQSGVLVSRHTLISYRTGLRALMAHAAERAWNLLRPSRDDAQGYVNTLLGQGRKIKTVQSRVAAGVALYRALRWAEATAAEPFRDVVLPRDREHPLDKNRPYTKREVEAVLTVARAEAQAVTRTRQARQSSLGTLTLVVLLSSTGLRIDEALGLEWTDVTFGGDDPELLVRRGKGRKSRTVPLPSALSGVLQAYRDAPRSRRHPALRVFPYRTWQTAAYHLRPVFQRAGVEFRGFHAFRKYVGTQVYQMLQDFVEVAELLGHADVQTTRGYVRVEKRRLREATERL